MTTTLPWPAVSLPAVSIFSQSLNTELMLNGSLLLQHFGHLSPPSTSSELLELVHDKHLWIARTGSCHLHVSISFHGQRLEQRDMLDQIVDWILGFEVRWGLCFGSRGGIDVKISATNLGLAMG